MKYLLRILLLSIAVIPFFIWEALVTIWTFDKSGFKQLRKDYSDTVESNYRRAFKRRPRPSNF